MNGLLLAVSVLINVMVPGILRNSFCKRDVTCRADLYLFNALSSVLSVATLCGMAAATGALGVPSFYTAALGLVFGLITALLAILNMRALESGPLSYTNVIISCAMILPALSGLLFFGESVTPGQYVGVAFTVISFVCAVDPKNDSLGTSVKWFALCFAAFLLNGGVGIMQKVHQSSAHKDELGMFLIIAFAVSALFSFALAGFYVRKGQTVAILKPAVRQRTLLIVLATGIGVALCNQINLHLSGAMPAIIFYPVCNGASMLLTTAAGLILWREKLSRRQALGLAVGAAAIFLLSGVFF